MHQNREMQSISSIRKKLRKVLPRLDERQRRLVAAAEAKAMGQGGTRAVARATGMSEGRIRRGVAELAQRRDPMPGRVRKPGGGRKRETDKQPGLLDALRELTEGATRGDPEAFLLHVSRSWRSLSDALSQMGLRRGQSWSAGCSGRLVSASRAMRRTRKARTIPTGTRSSSISMPWSRNAWPITRQPYRSIRRKRNWLGIARTGARNCARSASLSR